MKYLAAFLIMIIGISSCKKIKTPDAIAEREKWVSSFSDSVEYYKDMSDRISLNLDEINSEIETLLSNFEMVRNPREVSGYYIMKGWNSKLPLINTGIYARINENEKLELIATLGGATFNQIGVNGIQSDVVRHDQAFNYRHERFNTVYFSGSKADSVAQYIAENYQKPLTLYYLEGSVKKSFSLPADEKNMIEKTWRLYSLKKQALSLQKELWLCSRKIETLRRFMNEE